MNADGATFPPGPILPAESAVDILRTELAATRRELSQATIEYGRTLGREAALKQQLDDLRKQQALVDADRVAAMNDAATLRFALAEAALHLKRCTPPRLFENDLKEVQAGYLTLAGDEAIDLVLQAAVEADEAGDAKAPAETGGEG